MRLPEYGSQECERLWRPLLEGIRDRLKSRGLDRLIAFGLPADLHPHWTHVAMFRRILPDAGWVRESHKSVSAYPYDETDRRLTVPVWYNSVVYGGPVPDPLVKRLYGWQHRSDHLVLAFHRWYTPLSLQGFPPPWSYRICAEYSLAQGRNGVGRLGGDYWRVGAEFVGDNVPKGGSTEGYTKIGNGGTLYNIYLRSQTFQTGLGGTTTDLFAPGPEGPVPTVRMENLREGMQEAEARVFIEKALLANEPPSVAGRPVRRSETSTAPAMHRGPEARPLPEALARTCQEMLDERTQAMRMIYIGAPDAARQGWAQRAERLYDLAGAVARSRAP